MGDPWPAPGEPLYRDEDTEEVLAFLEWEDSLCPGGCGHPRHESMARENEWAYRAETTSCHACAARRRAERKLADLDGVFTYAEKR